MSELRQVSLLQRLDQELSDKRAALQQVESRLGNAESLNESRARVLEKEQELEGLRQEQRNLEGEIQGYAEKLKHLDKEMYAGSKGSKELMAIQQEVDGLKSRRVAREDKLLEVMLLVEEAQVEAKSRSHAFRDQEQEWQRQQAGLDREARSLRAEVVGLEQKRNEAAARLDRPTLALYEDIRSRRGQGAARVERGMCQGCRLILPVGEWQRVRSGALVQCSSCGRILCLD